MKIIQEFANETGCQLEYFYSKNIHKKAQHLDKINTVYFLTQKFKIVYIGQTRGIRDRAQCHKISKNFDMVFTLKCDDEIHAKMLEVIAIRRFRPKINVNVKKKFYCGKYAA